MIAAIRTPFCALLLIVGAGCNGLGGASSTAVATQARPASSVETRAAEDTHKGRWPSPTLAPAEGWMTQHRLERRPRYGRGHDRATPRSRGNISRGDTRPPASQWDRDPRLGLPPQESASAPSPPGLASPPVSPTPVPPRQGLGRPTGGERAAIRPIHEPSSPPPLGVRLLRNSAPRR